MWGIVFTGGEGPAPEAVRRLIDCQTCSAGKPVTIAADSGLILAETAGTEPDWIIGDMDSPGTEERLRRYNPERIMRYNTDKDYTDTELAFDFLREKSCTEIWIFGGGGGRTDHIFGIRDLFERDFFPRRWLTARDDIRCIDGAGDAGILETRIESGSKVSVFPLCGGPWKAESRGLKWPLDSVRWERGLYGLSNAAVTDKIVINAVQGRFMVIFPDLEV